MVFKDAPEGLLPSPLELASYRRARKAMFRSTKRNVESEESGSGGGGPKKRISRVTDAEVFTRLFYYGTVQMGMGTDDFRLMPIWLFLDLWACHKQFLGIEKSKQVWSIGGIIPNGI